jgi:hypothetical protein
MTQTRLAEILKEERRAIHNKVNSTNKVNSKAFRLLLSMPEHIVISAMTLLEEQK